METPVFKLEGVMKTKEEPGDFEGPLALILLLLSNNKIEIRDIKISLILEQYLGYLEAMAELDLDIASEFVAMASHLTLIKTKMLLWGDKEITELQQLITSLETLSRGDLYTQIKAVSQALGAMYSPEKAMLPGPPEYLPQDSEYKYCHDGADLTDALLRVIGRENAMLVSLNPREPVYPRKVAFSIAERSAEILDRLKSSGDIRISVLFGDSSSRTELIATFLAVLELCRIGSVYLLGEMDDILVTYAGSGREPAAFDLHDEY